MHCVFYKLIPESEKIVEIQLIGRCIRAMQENVFLQFQSSHVCLSSQQLEIVTHSSSSQVRTRMRKKKAHIVSLSKLKRLLLKRRWPR